LQPLFGALLRWSHIETIWIMGGWVALARISERLQVEARVTMERIPGIEIVRRAYKIWEDAGKPDGKDQEFYHQAERELKDERRRPNGENSPEGDAS
jgi:Protein of unknown function (DUF2934)